MCLSFILRYGSVTVRMDTCMFSCHVDEWIAGLGSSKVDQVLKYTKYPKYIPSTSTGQVLIFLKST